MSTELTTMDSKVVPLRTGNKVGGIVPTTIEEAFRLATAVAKSGLAPSTLRTAEAITVAIMHGLELGLPPMMALNSIAVVNGRPTVYGSAIPALLLSRGFRIKETMIGGDNTRCAVCEVTRPDGTKIERMFSQADAVVAGLWGKQGPWKQYPDRMLQMRARGYAARDGAADVLAGLYLSEEAEDIPVQVVRKSSAEGKRDGSVDVFNALRAEIAAAPDAATVARIKANNAAVIETMPARWAQMIEDDLIVKEQDFAPSDQQSVLRALERELGECADAAAVEVVERNYQSALIAMDEAGREEAIDMIQATKGTQ